jgi:processive 1,2-diacylglycerol beta-glucosyltransferase
VASRIVFLSASVGVGHTAAAHAVSTAMRSIDPSIQTETLDSYKYAARMFSKVVADGYIGMVKTVPQVYGLIYDRAERATQAGAFRRWASQYAALNLRPVFERFQPSVVVCTHAFPCGVMAEYKRLYDPDLPVMGIVTDFVVHPFWIYRSIDGYAVATPEMRATLIARGVATDRIIVSGIPVDPRFGQPRLPIAELRAELGLPIDRRIVLMMGGGLGIGPLDYMIRALADVAEPIAGAIVVGRNRRLERRVLETAEKTEFPLRVFGFVNNVYDLMHASDVLLSKPGGLTSSEALAAELPMVLVKPLPGQEERNMRYLVSRRAAVRARGPRELVAAVRNVLAAGRENSPQREQMRLLRHPNAAVDVARKILSLVRP